MLTGKYLKYKPEITFEIFQKVWDKLVENGWRCDFSLTSEYNNFEGGFPILMNGNDSGKFGVYVIECIRAKDSEITVEEILGYNPFETKSEPFKVGDKLVGKSKFGSDITALSNPLGVVNKYFIADEIEYLDDKTVKLWANRSYWNCNISDISIYQETKSDEFVLPEKWYLVFKTRDVFDELCGKYNPNFIFYEDAGISNNNSSYTKLGEYYYLSRHEKYGKEITFDQFKKYVLKEDIEEKVEDKPKFEVGKWYKFFWKWNKTWYYGKFLSETDDCISFKYWTEISDKGFSNSQSNPSVEKVEVDGISEADLSEIQQYLPANHPDLIKPKEVVPEYVECIKGGGTITIGKILKVKEWTSHSYFKSECGLEPFKDLFKPSTKEAYDAQFKPKEEIMFKKDDYIVFTSGSYADDESFPINYVFKQGEDDYYLKVNIDAKGQKNGWRAFRNFNKKYNKVENSECDWRYATPEEIAEYDRLGKPYDVTTLSKSKSIEKWSVGSYVVFLKKLSNLNVGDIDRIYKESDGQCVMLDKFLALNHKARERDGDVKWFATLQEAEEFLKQLLNPKEMKYKDSTGKWWKIPDTKFINYIESETRRYGFNALGEWIDIPANIVTDNIVEASKHEVEEALLSYAKEKYPIGTKYVGIGCNSRENEVKGELHYYSEPNKITDGWGGAVYCEGRWAEIIEQPVKCEATKALEITKCPFNEGDLVSCYIDDDFISEGKIHYEDGYIYICQDVRDGTDCRDKLGYEYSWCVAEIDKDWNSELEEALATNIERLHVVNEDWPGMSTQNHLGAIYKESHEQAVANYMESRGMSMQESSIQLVNVPRI
jgi:hypothetical protein